MGNIYLAGFLKRVFYRIKVNTNNFIYKANNYKVPQKRKILQDDKTNKQYALSSLFKQSEKEKEV